MSVPKDIIGKAKNETEKIIIEALWLNGRYWSNKSDNFRKGSNEWTECEDHLAKTEQIIDKFIDQKVKVEVLE